jgi:hypothetical protein
VPAVEGGLYVSVCAPLALPKEVPPVFEEELLLYHWYVNPVPTPVVFNAAGEVPVHTL